ncbi:hypothetical protein [Pseudomonas chlororaphis]|uniref:hypothetical protein n=1 Tax=Pseudomonas chlororaphis TaxID=587753 RepID=UPI001FF094CB|nr:hypothetical protein [Pseudomonas chlororaphis]
MKSTPLLCPLLAAILFTPLCQAEAPAPSREGPLAGLGEQLAGYGIRPHAQFWSLSMKKVSSK